jgi:DNA-binding Xre family transcriptional regulator
MHNSTDLLPHLHERGLDYSPSQVYRLVTGQPERVPLKLLAALCDVFDCGLDDLLSYSVTAVETRRAADDTVVTMDRGARPKRARIVSDE